LIWGWSGGQHRGAKVGCRLLDLTSPDLGWLDDIIADADFPCETNGLVFCDTLAANYPKVIDYYLREARTACRRR
jgi:hypothetical protein